MKDMGPATMFIGVDIRRDWPNWVITLNKHEYIDDMLWKFKIHKAKGVLAPLDGHQELQWTKPTIPEKSIYQLQFGKLMHAMLGTRPNLAYTISTLAKFNPMPSAEHLAAAKQTLWYLHSTQLYGLQYSISADTTIHGFCDPDLAGDIETRRSTTAHVFILSNAAISWKSRRQSTVALFSTQAEYMGISEAAKEEIWLKHLFQEMIQSDCYQTTSPI